MNVSVSPLGEASAGGILPSFTPIRPLRGYAQSVLVRENVSGQMWVLKPDDRKHLIANEMIGRHIFSRMGLPVPDQKNLVMSELSSDTNLWSRDRSISQSIERRLLIRYLPDQLQQVVFEMVPPVYSAKVNNVEDFLGAFLVDICIENVDVRQSMFVQSGHSLKAVFIDHSHIFGGPEKLTCRRVRSKRSFDGFVLQAANQCGVLSKWRDLIQERLCEYFLEAGALVPHPWQRRDLHLMMNRIKAKVDFVQQFVELELERIRLKECRENVLRCSSDVWLGM